MVCGTWVPAIQQWWIANANRTFTFTCTSYTSPNPISSYGAQDDCGQGVDTRLFLQGVAYGELGLNTGAGLFGNQWRNWFVIIGGGIVGAYVVVNGRRARTSMKYSRPLSPVRCTYSYTRWPFYKAT